jgi:hypothetical protein
MDGETLATGSITHIRVKGNLDEKWADWFEGFVITSRDSGETLMSGMVADQAALHGILGKIRFLDLPLLLMVQTECPCAKTSCSRYRRCRECVAYHGEKGKLPHCFRARTKWDKHCVALMTGR